MSTKDSASNLDALLRHRSRLGRFGVTEEELAEVRYSDIGYTLRYYIKQIKTRSLPRELRLVCAFKLRRLLTEALYWDFDERYPELREVADALRSQVDPKFVLRYDTNMASKFAQLLCEESEAGLSLASLYPLDVPKDDKEDDGNADS